MNAQDLEALWNRIAVAQSRSQRLAESWLPAAAGPALNTTTPGTDTGLADDPTAISNPTSDTAGLGYTPLSETLPSGSIRDTPRRALASNERLRSLLLGTQAKNPGGAGASAGKPAQGTGMGMRSSLPSKGPGAAGRGPVRRTQQAMRDSGDEDDDLGRSAIGSAKGNKRRAL